VLGLSGDLNAGKQSAIPEEMRQALEAAGQGQALERALAADNFVFRPYTSRDEAHAALAERRLKGYFVIPQEYMREGRLDVYTPDSFNVSGSDSRNALSDLLRRRLVEQRLDPALSARVVRPIDRTRRFAVTRTGEVRDGGSSASILRFAVPLVFMVLFLISVLMTSGYLMQGTATEKENKVVDVLLASANPDQILAGKLLGLGGAGLLQIAVWLTMLMVTGVGVVPMLMSARVDVPWLALALAAPFFVIAFLFFGGLMLGTGSLGSNMREAQQLAMVWSLTAAAPMMMMAVRGADQGAERDGGEDHDLGAVHGGPRRDPAGEQRRVAARLVGDRGLAAGADRGDLDWSPRRSAPVPNRHAQRRRTADASRDRAPGAAGLIEHQMIRSGCL
jgi:ABC-2 type transport system permease protein